MLIVHACRLDPGLLQTVGFGLELRLSGYRTCEATNIAPVRCSRFEVASRCHHRSLRATCRLLADELTDSR